MADAIYNSGNQKYWSEGEPTPSLLKYPDYPNIEKYWVDGQPAELLISFLSKESMFEIF
jgi:hypothetical protein